ncbi:uncharacterized protein RSE6_12482 [Rhynchosporium secalis]|uniref:Uncharacterized protein n=1 Tax=Rhynchosporium secalis TaxID=38038 RepID=A0A1E1MQJ2_RHYSE|nr:uncharacterized protein RSE6_12482 [Rhynchosporium secalis]
MPIRHTTYTVYNTIHHITNPRRYAGSYTLAEAQAYLSKENIHPEVSRNLRGSSTDSHQRYEYFDSKEGVSRYKNLVPCIDIHFPALHFCVRSQTTVSAGEEEYRRSCKNKKASLTNCIQDMS